MTDHAQSDHPAGYEKRDASVRGILIAAAITVLFVAISVIFLYFYFQSVKEEVIYALSG